MSQIEITQIKSLNGQSPRARAVIKALGLKWVGHTRQHKDNNCIRGMVNKVKHLVRYTLAK